MTQSVNKSFDSPEETRSMDKGKVEVVNLGDVQVMRATFQPGWKWSQCVKPVVGTDSCKVAHLMYTVSGHMVIKMDDGATLDIKAGDVSSVPPGHDAWIVGDEPFVAVDFQGASTYAKPQK